MSLESYFSDLFDCTEILATGSTSGDSVSTDMAYFSDLFDCTGILATGSTSGDPVSADVALDYKTLDRELAYDQEFVYDFGAMPFRTDWATGTSSTTGSSPHSNFQAADFRMPSGAAPPLSDIPFPVTPNSHTLDHGLPNENWADSPKPGSSNSGTKVAKAGREISAEKLYDRPEGEPRKSKRIYILFESVGSEFLPGSSRQPLVNLAQQRYTLIEKDSGNIVQHLLRQVKYDRFSTWASDGPKRKLGFWWCRHPGCEYHTKQNSDMNDHRVTHSVNPVMFNCKTFNIKDPNAPRCPCSNENGVESPHERSTKRHYVQELKKASK